MAAVGAYALAVFGLLSLGAGAARAEDTAAKDFRKILDKVLEEAATPEDRIEALHKARAAVLVDTQQARKDELQKALDTLLRQQLAPKRNDPNVTKIADVAFRDVMSTSFTSFPDLGKVVKPYLKDTPATTREAALMCVELIGAQGIGPDLVAIWDEPAAMGARDQARHKLDLELLRATKGLPSGEALDVLEAALQKSKNKIARSGACRAIGDMVLLRNPKTVDKGKAVNVLKEIVKAKGRDADLGDAAAVALARLNVWDGVGAIFERLDSKLPQAVDYDALCQLSLHSQGFEGVTVKLFDGAYGPTRDAALKAAKDWWTAAQKATPEKNLMDALYALGIQTPKDPSSRDAVGALIDGLGAKDRTIRYAALDFFVQKTGRTDVALKFKVLHLEMSNGKIRMDKDEPPEGFQDPGMAAQLAQQQDEKSKKLRSEWDQVKDKATNEGGVWVAPWPAEASAAKPGK